MMNRLQLKLPVGVGLAAAPATWVQSGQFSSSNDANPSAQSWFAPLHYEANYAYPLLIWLHGGGDSEHQLRRIMPHISLRNYVAVALRGTLQVPRRSGSGTGYRFVQAAAHVAQAEERVLGAIEEAQRRFNVRTDRVFLAGYECGGTMAFRLAASYPSNFAGVLSLCGPFPSQGAPLANLNSARQLPLFVASCRQGRFYPAGQVCDDLRLFHSAGMSITLREYPGEDSLAPSMLADVDRWIMEQINGPAEAADVAGPRETGVG
jgi:phospholipase/carboxylesterase